jgi:pantoate--beta-alanine ligase
VIVVSSTAELDAIARPRGAVATVMTMGALHRGHTELMRIAREAVGPDGIVIATVFVNPAQFGPSEDFERYPRTLDDDVAASDTAGVDIVFAPSVVEIYGSVEGLSDDSVTVDPGPLGDILEGATRRGHFRGVLTVVNKLLSMTAPDVAFFGEKDYQQLVLIRRMVRDLSMRPRIVGVPTVREPDGLALSSRNRYLSVEERITATTLPHALETVAATTGEGVEAALAAGREVAAATAGIALDYLEIVDPDLGPAPAAGPARALIAARVGTTRLIDNVPCWVGAR